MGEGLGSRCAATPNSQSVRGPGSEVEQEAGHREYRQGTVVPGAWHGVSAERLLGHIDIGDAKPDIIITGGESGPGFRPLDMDALRSLRDQCARNGVTFHHKQNGGIYGK